MLPERRWIKVIVYTYDGYKAEGISICNESDTFDTIVGTEMAFSRAVRKLSGFSNTAFRKMPHYIEETDTINLTPEEKAEIDKGIKSCQTGDSKAWRDVIQ